MELTLRADTMSSSEIAQRTRDGMVGEFEGYANAGRARAGLKNIRQMTSAERAARGV
jgi:hypothetical protein